jgi:hypothetical protein
MRCFGRVLLRTGGSFVKQVLGAACVTIFIDQILGNPRSSWVLFISRTSVNQTVEQLQPLLPYTEFQPPSEPYETMSQSEGASSARKRRTGACLRRSVHYE